MIHGPWTSSSPTLSPSHGTSAPSGPTSRAWTPRREPALGLAVAPVLLDPVVPAGATAVVPSGDISVIPQAWITVMSWRSCMARISAGGQADPPTTTERSEEVSVGCSSR